MLLTIDIGNTMTDFGAYEGREPKYYYRTRSRKDLTLEEAIASFTLYLKSNDIDPSSFDGAILSSVVPLLTDVYLSLCQKMFGIEPKVLGPKLKSGLRIVTDNPKEVGGDMVAAAVGAKERFGFPCLVVDCGTANKVFLLDHSGAFVGCTIGAGIGLQAASLSSSAALLPEVSIQTPSKILGKNTADCMNSALTYGNAFGLRELVNALEKEAGYPCKRVLTGGYSEAIRALLPEFAYAPSLVLDGLCDIYWRNQE